MALKSSLLYRGLLKELLSFSFLRLTGDKFLEIVSTFYFLEATIFFIISRIQVVSSDVFQVCGLLQGLRIPHWSLQRTFRISLTPVCSIIDCVVLQSSRVIFYIILSCPCFFDCEPTFSQVPYFISLSDCLEG